MSASSNQPQTMHYQAAGSLLKPLLLGRMVRLLLGILCLGVVWQLSHVEDPGIVRTWSYWLLILLAMLLVNYVVNIGFGMSTGNWPAGLSAVAMVSAALYSVLTGAPWLGEPVLLVTLPWLLYVFGHLGLSFVIAAALATPGCEMRALPHLLGRVRNSPVAEHACPAMIDALDNWEHGRREQGTLSSGQTQSGESSRDLVGTPGRMLLVYGLPFVAIQLAGMFGGFQTATAVPAGAFLLVGIVSVINLVRCRRVHSFLLGPLFLLAGSLMGLYNLRLISLGPDTWSIIVNTALIAGVCLAIKLEFLFGKYPSSAEKKAAQD